MSKRNSEAVLLTDLILEVFRLNGCLINVGNRLTKPHGLTSARWQVMGAIELEERPLTVAQIARRMGLARQGVQRIVSDLERAGMLVLEDNADHKRAKLVSLSRVGEQTMARIDKVQIAWVNGLTVDLSTKQIKQGLKLLKIVRERCGENDT